MTKYKVANIDTIKEVVEYKECVRLKWIGEKKSVILDLFTASVILKCYESASPETKEKMERMISASSGQFMKITTVCLSICPKR